MSPLNRLALFLLLLLPLVACQPAGEEATPAAGAPEAAVPSAPDSELLKVAEAAAEVIDEAALRTHIATLSDDAMGGRAPGAEGDILARNYIAEQMAAVGLEPGGVDGTWEQPFDIVGVDSEVPETWTFQGADSEVALNRGSEFVAFSGVQSELATLENAELVFVGYGIEAPEYQWDDSRASTSPARCSSCSTTIPIGTMRSSKATDASTMVAGATNTSRRPSTVPPAPSCTTLANRPVTVGMSSKAPGADRNSNCRRVTRSASRSPAGRPKSRPKS